MTPPHPTLPLLLLGVTAFSLATTFQPWSETRRTHRSGSVLEALLGDGRRLFANHFFAKADAYFHRGVYPSIFDPPRQEEMHMVSETQAEPDPEHPAGESDHDHDHDHEADPSHNHDHGIEAETHSTGAPTDWIARLNAHFSPSGHTHLGGGDTREMLPWLKLSAELDPSNVENYTVTAYWLRNRVNRPDEAEQFLRQGLRHNPGNPEILLELALLQLENRHQPRRAANILELALKRWTDREQHNPKPDYSLLNAILIRLARIEMETGFPAKALEHLQHLREHSPNPAAIDLLILDVQTRITNAPAPLQH